VFADDGEYLGAFSDPTCIRTRPNSIFFNSPTVMLLATNSAGPLVDNVRVITVTDSAHIDFSQCTISSQFTSSAVAHMISGDGSGSIYLAELSGLEKFLNQTDVPRQ